MTFALVQISPFQVIQSFQADAPPDPVRWPDGAVTHGIATSGVTHGPWALLPTNFTPAAPTQFHSLGTTIPTLNGTSVTFQQVWIPAPLGTVQNALLASVSNSVGQASSNVIDNSPMGLFIFQERLAEARSLGQWFLATTVQPSTSSYPLLFATVGVERAPDGSVSTTMANIMFKVLNSYSQLVTDLAPMVRGIAAAHVAINACTTVVDAVSAFNTISVNPIGTAIAST